MVSDAMDSMMTRYEEDISLHDCREWELQLEKQALVRNVSGLTVEKRTTVKTELIDVDLIRGSTFPKPHPRHALPSMLWFSLLSCVFFPLRKSWWIRHTNTTVYLVGCLVFISSLSCLALHHLVLCQDSAQYCDQVSLQEVWEPVALFIVLAFLHCHILSPIKTNLEIFPVRRSRLSPSPRRQTSATRGSGSRRSAPRTSSPREPGSQSSGQARASSAEGPALLRNRRSTQAVLDCWYENVTSGSEAEGQETEGDESPGPLHSEARTSESEQEVGGAQTRHSRDYTAQGSVVVSEIGCTVWGPDSAPAKVHLSALEIGNSVYERAKEFPNSMGYAIAGLCSAILIALTPLAFKLSAMDELVGMAVTRLLPHSFILLLPPHFHVPPKEVSQETFVFYSVIFIAAINRLVLTVAIFFLLSVAERAFKRRFLTAKLFSHLTSTRRSLKSNLPHFRLYKVRNIKAWLCVRSFLRRRGPQRSIDCIVSTAFLMTLCNVVYLCIQLLREDKEEETSQVTDLNCEVLAWCVAMSIFLIRFMTLASKINQKYRNLSVLLTEQINLYLQMEQKPHKKEQLQLANNVLKLSSDLLKELETPYKIHGLSANPFLYNCTRVLILSAISGVLSEMLGFKLKLYKVKIK